MTKNSNYLNYIDTPVYLQIKADYDSSLKPGSWKAFVFDWKNIDDEEKWSLLEEQMSTECQNAVQDGNIVPFAVLGSTEESGEEETLINILDCQIDGILFFDSNTFEVYHSDEGTLRKLKVKVDDLKFKAREDSDD